jgi:imidazolonepropionase-like amidohydrolase
VKLTILLADQLIDGRSAAATPDGAVVIREDRIAWAGTVEDMPATMAEDATVHRFPGCSLLPGFIDVHTHFTLFADGRSYEQMAAEPDGLMLLAGARNSWMHLAAGVTTARDNGSRGTNGFELRDAILRDIVLGPRLLVAGAPLTPTGGHFHWCDGTADGEDGVQRQVRCLVSQGADHIKIMASGGKTVGTDPARPCYTTGELRAATGSAHDLGKLTSAHCRASESMRRAIEAGVDCIEHGEFIDPDGTMRFDERIVSQMADHGSYLCPTLQTSGWHTILSCRRVSESRELSREEAQESLVAQQRTEQRLEQINKIVEMGLSERIVAGTDAGCFDFSFGHIDYEMHLMVAAGMSPMASIMSATSVAALACGIDDQVGSLEEGKLADIVVVRGDPLAAIDRTGDVESVYRRGVEVRRFSPIARPDDIVMPPL